MNIENLRRGMWITVVHPGKKTVFGEEIDNEFRWKGVPLQVKAINPPFILVTLAREVIMPINITGMEIMRLNSSYVAAYFDRRGYKKRMQQQKNNNALVIPDERIYG